MTKNKTRIVAEPGKQEILVTRIFDAPREMVFRAYTDPKLIPRWWGPRMLETYVEKMEPRSGGSWRFIHTDPDGKQFAFHGVYHEVYKSERIIDTFEYEGLSDKGHVVLETSKFEPMLGGKTKLTLHMVFQSVQDRDGMIHTGMEMGLVEGHERLDIVLEALRQALQ